MKLTTFFRRYTLMDMAAEAAQDKLGLNQRIAPPNGPVRTERISLQEQILHTSMMQCMPPQVRSAEAAQDKLGLNQRIAPLNDSVRTERISLQQKVLKIFAHTKPEV